MIRPAPSCEPMTTGWKRFTSGVSSKNIVEFAEWSNDSSLEKDVIRRAWGKMMALGVSPVHFSSWHKKHGQDAQCRKVPKTNFGFAPQ